MYRKEWECCNSVTETDAWEPDECPFCSQFRTKDLTDDEIYTLYSEPCSDREMVEFARAVIAADREKNRG